MGRIRRAERLLALANGRPPSPDELAAAVGMNPERLMKLRWSVLETDCAEGDAPVGDGEATLLSLKPDPSASPFDLIANRELKEHFDEVLATLNPREERVLRMRFGIGLDRDHTLESVGQEFGVTRERIRQIEAKALRKLSFRTGHLKSFLQS
jgi:RNA polymerase primary sigma factor